MKKFFNVILISISTFAGAQCTIEGPSRIDNQKTQSYSIPNEKAQCENCHQWSVVGSSRIIGDNRKNQVKLDTSYSGNTLLNVTVLTPDGIELCTKNINIQNQNSNSTLNNSINPNYSDNKRVDCDIDINTYKEIKYSSNTVALFPNADDNGYTYNWEVVYALGGQPSTSTEKVPTFTYEVDNFIKKISLKITSNKCIKKFSKEYNQSFWKFLGTK